MNMKPKPDSTTSHNPTPGQAPKPQQSGSKSLEKQTKENTTRRVARKPVWRSLPWESHNWVPENFLKGGGEQEDLRYSLQWSQEYWVLMHGHLPLILP